MLEGDGVFATLVEALADGDLRPLCLTMPVGAIVVEDFLNAPVQGDRCCWLPAVESGVKANDESCAGIGSAIHIIANGPGRFAALKSAAARIISSAREIPLQDDGVSIPLRFTGGAAFFDSFCNDAEWRNFASADFAVPRWTYCLRGRTGLLRVVVSPEVIGDVEAALAEAAQLDAWLAAKLERPRGRVPDAALQESEEDRVIFNTLVLRALADIEARRIEKVVVSRTVKVSRQGALDLAMLMRQMGAVSPDCHRFAVERGGVVFAGATPERLVRVDRQGHRAMADALAGSMFRSLGGPQTDQLEVNALLSSEKERREFDYVKSFLCERLQALCGEVSTEPVRVRTFSHLHHLHTGITAQFPEHPVHVLDVVNAVHPTPAVCGTPAAEASAWLRANEPYERGWYAGPVGWFGADGDGEFAVGIRSALLSVTEARLFAGAGIVRGSDPASEWAETQNKQAAMFAALEAQCETEI